MKNKFFAIMLGVTFLLSSQLLAQSTDDCNKTLYGNIKVGDVATKDGQVSINGINYITCTDKCNVNISDDETLFKVMLSLYKVHDENGAIIPKEFKITDDDAKKVIVKLKKSETRYKASSVMINTWRDYDGAKPWRASVASNYLEESVSGTSTVDLAYALYDALTSATKFYIVKDGSTFAKDAVIAAVIAAPALITTCEDSKSSAKQNLNDRIVEAKYELNFKPDLYSKADHDLLAAAIATAEDAYKTSTTLQQLKDAKTALGVAKDALTKIVNNTNPPADTAQALKDLTDYIATIDPSKYTGQIQTDLQDAIDAANLVAADNSATLQQLKDALAALKAAKVKADNDTTQALKDLTDYIAAIDVTGFSGQDKIDLQKAIDAANLIVKKNGVTVKELQDALATLKTAKDKADKAKKAKIDLKGIIGDDVKLSKNKKADPKDVAPVSRHKDNVVQFTNRGDFNKALKAKDDAASAWKSFGDLVESYLKGTDADFQKAVDLVKATDVLKNDKAKVRSTIIEKLKTVAAVTAEADIAKLTPLVESLKISDTDGTYDPTTFEEKLKDCSADMTAKFATDSDGFKQLVKAKVLSVELTGECVGRVPVVLTTDKTKMHVTK